MKKPTATELVEAIGEFADTTLAYSVAQHLNRTIVAEGDAYRAARDKLTDLLQAVLERLPA